MRTQVGLFIAALFSSLWGPSPSQAQERGPTSPPRFYVGVHLLYRVSYQVFYPDTPGSAGPHPWQLTVGGNVTPRLALQAGLSYTREHQHMDPSYTGTMLNGDYVDGSFDSKRWTYCVPVLARYAVVRFPKPRLQVDGLLGWTLLGTQSREQGEQRVNGQVVHQSTYLGQATNGYYTFGMGVRCPFGRHVEGVVDWTYNRNVRPSSEAVNFNTTGNQHGFTRALTLGLRYRFNGRKKPSAF
jgi:hypothetical protein